MEYPGVTRRKVSLLTSSPTFKTGAEIVLAGLLATLGIVVVGCGPQKTSISASPTNPPTPAATNNSSAIGNPLTAPVDYLGAVSKAKRFAEKTVDLVSLNRTIQLFEAQEDRFPKDLNELVTLRYLPVLPAPPPGMKLTYNPANGRVNLIRQ